MNVRKDTARTIVIGPILDSAGAAKTDEVVGSVLASKNGGNPTALDSTGPDVATLTHKQTGYYLLYMTANDIDTLGCLEISLNSTTNTMPIVRMNVATQLAWDAMYAASGGTLPVSDSSGVTELLTRVPDATAGEAGGLLVAGSNAATTFATLTVSGATALSGGVTTTTIAASGAVTAASLTLSGVLQANSLIVSTTTALTGAVTLGAALTVTGTTTLAALAQVGAVSLGATTLASMAVTGAVSVGTTTTLTGAVSLGSTLGVTGTVTFAALTVTAALTAGSNAVPWNAAWDTEVQSECNDALTAWDKTGFSLAAAGLDLVLAESGITAGAGLTDDAGTQLTAINARQALAAILSACAAVLAGAATTSIAIKQAAKPAGNTRITATVDADGNRSAVTLKVPT